MGPSRIVVMVIMVLVLALGSFTASWGGQVWTKCHITCRCLQDDSVGNFAFAIPVDQSPDIGFEADQACNSYGHKICLDGCNSVKFSYTYQVTSP
jgi:hypothetical protein